MTEILIQQYRNPVFESRCIPYTFIAYNYIKQLKLPNIKKLSLKSYLLDEKNDKSDPNNKYTSYHYYLEILYEKNNIYREFIIDNETIDEYKYFKSRYKPKKIKTFLVKEIKMQSLIFENDAYNNIKILIKKDIDSYIKRIEFLFRKLEKGKWCPI